MRLHFLTLPAEERRLYIEQAAVRRNLSPVLREKDSGNQLDDGRAVGVADHQVPRFMMSRGLIGDQLDSLRLNGEFSQDTTDALHELLGSWNGAQAAGGAVDLVTDSRLQRPVHEAFEAAYR